MWNYLKIIIITLISLNVGTLNQVLAIKLNLTESCSVLFCSLSNLQSSYDDPLQLLNSSAPQLNELIISQSSLSRIPADLFLFAPQLKILSLHRSGVVRLSANDFAKAAHLQYLLIQRNRLSDVPERVFVFASELQELILGQNAVHMLHKNAFAGLTKLRFLDLQANCISELPDAIFGELSLLEHLDLSHNDLQKIDSSTFATNRQLKTLLLSDNKFRVFEPNSLTHLTRLGLLDISHTTGMDEISLQTVHTLKADNANLQSISIEGSVEYLSAVHNNIQSLKVGDKTSVQYLNLSLNNFNSMEDFMGMWNLITLDLSKNHIQTITTSSDAFVLGLPSLMYLNLGHNKLTNLNANHFLKLSKLKYLDLAYNFLFKLNASTFEPLGYLEQLFFEGNGIHSIDYPDLCKNLPYLQEIGIYDNKMELRYLGDMIAFFMNHNIYVSSRYNSMQAADNQIRSLCDNPWSQQQIIGSLSGIHPYWTKRDILALFTLLVVLIIMIMQICYILREEHCFRFCFSRSTRRVQRDNQIHRLSEDDSEV